MSEPQLNSLAKALEADRAAFRALADALPVFVWLSHADGRALFFNKAMRSYTGLLEHSRLEQGFRELVHPDDADALLRYWHECRVRGALFAAELRLRHRSDDTYHWFLSQACPVRDNDGEIAYWLGCMTDVDAQKRATENLQFVIETSDSLTSATTIQEVCTCFADVAIRQFADWAFVVISRENGKVDVSAIAHRDSNRVKDIQRFLERYPVDEDRLRDLLAAKKPALFPVITDEQMRRSARDDDHLAVMRDLHLYSAIVAPFVYADRVLGGVIMYSAESRHEFDQHDVEVLEVLANRSAARIGSMQALSDEQRERRRLQFISRATESVYESFDLTTAFGNLTEIIVEEIADMAAVFRLEEHDAVRLVGATHRDPAADDVARSMIGIRVMHGDAERKFVRTLQSRKPLVGTEFGPGRVAKSVWPYLSEDVAALQPKSLVTVPLHSRGRVHGAIVAYYTENGREFQQPDVDLLVEIGRHASVALENADVFERERRMSETLQDSLLPPSLPQVEGLSFDAVYLPSATEAQVGGDWYDAFQLEDGTTVVTAGDVTGRGADAAVIMGKVRHLLAIAPSYERDPARILDTVESVLARRYPDTIVTAFLGFIDPEHKKISYANAGHPPPLLRTESDVQELHAEGLPIGLRLQAPHSHAEVAGLGGARMLVLYTDGLTESSHDVIAGYRRLREVVLRDARSCIRTAPRALSKRHAWVRPRPMT